MDIIYSRVSSGKIGALRRPRLIHLVPDDDYKHAHVEWASWKMLCSLWDALLEANEEKVKNIINSTKRLGAYGSLRGFVVDSILNRHSRRLGHRKPDLWAMVRNRLGRPWPSYGVV